MDADEITQNSTRLVDGERVIIKSQSDRNAMTGFDFSSDTHSFENF